MIGLTEVTASSTEEAQQKTISLFDHCVIIERLKDEHRAKWNEVKRENLEALYCYNNKKQELEQEKEAHNRTKEELKRLQQRYKEQEEHYQLLIKGYEALRTPSKHATVKY